MCQMNICSIHVIRMKMRGKKEKNKTLHHLTLFPQFLHFLIPCECGFPLFNKGSFPLPFISINNLWLKVSHMHLYYTHRKFLKRSTFFDNKIMYMYIYIPFLRFFLRMIPHLNLKNDVLVCVHIFHFPEK